MHQLVSEGVSESDALVKILPDDNNRSTKLKLWKKSRLWPVPPDELRREPSADPSKKKTPKMTHAGEAPKAPMSDQSP
jgi:hypothetical protein